MDPTFFSQAGMPRESVDSLRDFAGRLRDRAAEAQAARAEASRFAMAFRDALKLTKAIEQQQQARHYHGRVADFLRQAKANDRRADDLEAERDRVRAGLTTIQGSEAAE
jgi:hypothetical protein